MTTRNISFEPWQWSVHAPAAAQKKEATTTSSARPELWAGAVYLLVWSVLWLAVIVSVLAPLDGVFSGVAR